MAEKWRSWGSRSVVGSGGLVVVGLVLIGVGLMGVVWVLLFVCLLWLFYEVGVWLRTIGMGM
jgi:hypothetical protein